jgi:hypothetical protein
MENLPFTHNWNNTLDCDAYTTIRIFNPKKHFPGQNFNVTLNGRMIHQAVVLQVKQIRIVDVNEFIARLDTGYSAAECQTILRKMYGEKADLNTYGFMLLKKIKQ